LPLSQRSRRTPDTCSTSKPYVLSRMCVGRWLPPVLWWRSACRGYKDKSWDDRDMAQQEPTWMVSHRDWYFLRQAKLAASSARITIPWTAPC